MSGPRIHWRTSSGTVACLARRGRQTGWATEVTCTACLEAIDREAERAYPDEEFNQHDYNAQEAR